MRARPFSIACALAAPALAWVMFAPVSNGWADCPTVICDFTHPDVIVGSPSGLAGPSVTIGLSGEVWLSMDDEVACNPTVCQGGVLLYSADPAGGTLHCGNQFCWFPHWPYLEGFDGFFESVRLGGHGTLAVQLEATEAGCSGPGTCSGYIGFKCVEARSTDFDADGHTDQNDKIAIGLALASPNPASYFDVKDPVANGVPDTADYNLIVTEMRRGPIALYRCRAGRIPPYPCGNEGAPGDPLSQKASSPTVSSTLLPPPPPCDTLPIPLNADDPFALDTNAPGATILSQTGAGPNVTLNWTSPGNDTHMGQQIGLAELFDLRGSPNPIITEADFSSATPITGEPAPGLPGTAHSMTLNACAQSLKYFAIKTKDHAGNASAMSNVVSDVLAPEAVVLGSTCVGTTGLLLSWTSPGDDGSVGTATAYDIRQSLSPINDGNFNSATPIAIIPAPEPAGTYQETPVTGLAKCKWYYFGLKTRDEFCNWSALSTFAVRTFCSGVGTCGASTTDVPPTPTHVGLAALSPNPAAVFTRITCGFSAQQEGRQFDLAVYDVSGRHVRALASGIVRAGERTTDWDLHSDAGIAVGPGIYFARLRVGADQYTRTVLVAP